MGYASRKIWLKLTRKTAVSAMPVSTYGQTLDAQLEQLRGAACTKIYREKVTGAHSDRRELLKPNFRSLNMNSVDNQWLVGHFQI